MRTFYVDAGTRNNGKYGHQETIVVVTDENGTVIFEKEVGDYTNNQGEILAIIAVMKRVAPKEQVKIISDSQIAIGWAQKGNRPLKERAEKNLPPRTRQFIEYAHKLLTDSKSVLMWLPREFNLAGYYIEDKYSL